MIKKIKTGCFIMCRLNSTRLPAKALAKIENKTILEHVIDRAKMAKLPDVVVLCTPIGKDNDVLENIARSKGIEVFRGPVNNTLAEFRGAADRFNVDFFAVYTADDIFCEPELIDAGLVQMIDGKYDFINIPDELICGGSAYCISSSCLRRICDSRDTKNSSFFPSFFKEDKHARIADLKTDESLYRNSEIRMTLDYPEDLKFFRTIFNKLKIKRNSASLKKIIKFLNKNPEIIKINYFRQKDFINNQAK